MALKGSTFPTLPDVMVRAGVTASDIINMTSQMNPMLEDAPAYPCNKGTYHETQIKTGLPSVTWGRLYKGIPASKDVYQTVKHTPGYIQGAVQVDARIIDNVETNVAYAAMRGTKKKNAVAMGQAKLMESLSTSMNESMAISAAEALLYANQATNPDRITGFKAFFPTVNMANSQTASQVVDAGGTGADNTSMLMATWGESVGHFIYPDAPGCAGGFKPGKTMRTFEYDSERNRYDVYRREFRWDLGLTVRDWRYYSMLVNIDVSNLLKGDEMGFPTVSGNTSANLIDLMSEAYYRNHGRRRLKGKTYWYGNTTMVQYIDYQARNTPKNLWLGFEQTGVNAAEVLTHRRVPIKESDAFLNTEGRVS